MGERGPARTPTSILKLRGSWLAKTRGGEPRPPPGKPRCPVWISKEAKRAWAELIPQLEMMGLLARCDRNILVRYCQTLAMWRAAQEWIIEHGDVFPEKDSRGRVVGLKEYPHVSRVIRLSEHLLRLEKPLGLSPSARAGLVVSGDAGVPIDLDKERFFSVAAMEAWRMRTGGDIDD